MPGSVRKSAGASGKKAMGIDHPSDERKDKSISFSFENKKNPKSYRINSVPGERMF